MEKFFVAYRTERGYFDVRCRDAKCAEIAERRALQIKHEFVFSGLFAQPGIELRGNIRAHLVTALRRRRTDEREHVRRARAERIVHRVECFHGDMLRRPAPSGMDSGNNTVTRVVQKYRLTIRNAYAQINILRLRYKRVVRVHNARAVNNGYVITMHLLLQNKTVGPDTKRFAKPPSVLRNVLL